jgi:hypothetical protein
MASQPRLIVQQDQGREGVMHEENISMQMFGFVVKLSSVNGKKEKIRWSDEHESDPEQGSDD